MTATSTAAAAVTPRLLGTCLTGFEALPCRDVLAVLEAHAQALAEYRATRHRGACYAEISLKTGGGPLAVTHLRGENFYFWRGHRIGRQECLSAIAVAKLVSCNQLQWED